MCEECGKPVHTPFTLTPLICSLECALKRFARDGATLHYRGLTFDVPPGCVSRTRVHTKETAE